MKLAIWSYQAPAHVGVTKAASSFSGIHTILRAPKGDGYAAIMFAMFERLGVVPPMTVSALTQATLAGAPADIGCAISDVDRRLNPEMIVVTRSATASVLQEPLDGEIAMIPAGTIHAEIFQPRTHPMRDTEVTAFAKTVAQIVEHYIEDHPRTEQPSINIIGPSLLGFHDMANVESMRRIFTDAGVQVNAVVPLGSSPDDLRTLSRAWLNVTTAYELAQPTLDLLKERFGTPFVASAPYGESGTNAWLAEVAQILELPRERIRYAARNARLAWYARTVDAHALSSKRIAVFGLPTAAAGIARVMRDELDMQVEFVGTYALSEGDAFRDVVADLCEEVLVTDDFQVVADAIDRTRPDIMFGSQMERHSAGRIGVPCAVVSPPAHILNFPLGYAPFVGYDGANHLGDLVNQTQVLGLEHHLIETFGPRGQGRFVEAAPEPDVAEVIVPSSLRWESDAERLIARVPFFVRKKARANVERYAREHGVAAIDEAVVIAAREHFGG